MLRLGTNVWPGYELFYLARDLNYYDEHRIRLVESTSATQVIHAFRNGAIDAAALTLDEVLLLAQDEVDFKLVAILDYSNGADCLLGQPGIKTLSALQDKRVGVEDGALGGYMLNLALHQARLTRAQVKIVSLPVNEHERAFEKGQIDAVVTFDPVCAKLERHGATRLFDSAALPGKILDVLIIRSTYLEQHGDRVQELLRGWLQAQDYLRNAPQDAARRMTGRMALPPDEVLESFKGVHILGKGENLQMMAGNPSHLEATLRSLQEHMLEQHMLSAALSNTSFIDERSLKILP
jgi:NitT/TauT family transport system substrate-binding protein